MKRHIIDGIEEGSIAQELEIEAGDVLLAINDKEIEDIFDYQYLVEDEYLEILIEKKNGEEWLLEVEKEQDEDLGLLFGESLMDNYRNCHNKCVFCFIDQNPKGMRETIYFKDDDTRLSFLQGNYVSLTNLKEKDIKRIIEYKLAPINISVHTTNPELRCKMLNNRFAGNVLEYIDMLYEAGIPMNAQIVLCKGLNDGDELERTLNDLIKYAPILESVTIVPVGLTKHRDGLCQLESFNKQDAINLIEIVNKYQDIAVDKFGVHFVHASDEWYINANVPIPSEENYDGYGQLENGVGMVRLMHSEIDNSIEDYLEQNNGNIYEDSKKVSIVCGMLVKDYMVKATDKIKKVAPNVDIQVYPIRNDFFGEKITVTGLLTGGDIVAQLKGKDLGDALMLPCNCLKADEDIFLDDMTLEEFQNALQVPVIIVQSSGMDFLSSIIEMEK
ncbi:MAG: DUF512 domain-containing protein [Lachnospiraceae bacterium]|nr:DUF512 domain-containing protein [Lachnospiraceae bacterium]